MTSFVNPLAPRRAPTDKVRQIKTWVRESRDLDDDVVLSVTELACRDDHCPDIETVVGILRPGEKIETIRVHKAISVITIGDFATEAPSLATPFDHEA